MLSVPPRITQNPTAHATDAKPIDPKNRNIPTALQNAQQLAMAITCHDNAQDSHTNIALAPAIIGPLVDRSILDQTPGSQSAQMHNMYKGGDPIDDLFKRFQNVIRDTGQEYKSYTCLLARSDKVAAIKNDLKDRNIKQEVSELTPDNIAKENAQITKVTNNRIPGFLTPSDAVFSLCNALYLKAKWAKGYGFDPAYTDERPFTTSDGQIKTVPTMLNEFSSGKLRFVDDNNMRAVKLNFMSNKDAKDDLVMIVAMKKGSGQQLPDRNELEEVMEQLDKRPPRGMTELYLPKFKTNHETDLLSLFKTMGLGAALAQDQKKLPGAGIDSFVQRCFFEIDEEGAEAAAVTAMCCVDGIGSAPPIPKHTLRFDQPFRALICLDKRAVPGKKAITPLFSAEIRDPSLKPENQQ